LKLESADLRSIEQGERAQVGVHGHEELADDRSIEVVRDEGFQFWAMGGQAV
jgi:hypothetical protein